LGEALSPHFWATDVVFFVAALLPSGECWMESVLVAN
jgi:hypothetical protein